MADSQATATNYRHDTFPYRIADAQNHGWLGDGEGNYHGFDPTGWRTGRLLDKRPLADVVAEFGPIRPVEPPSDQDVAELRAAFELAGRKLIASIASAIEQVYHEAREVPGGSWTMPDPGTTADYAQRTLTAGRPGSWEAEALMNVMLFGNELNLWPYKASVPVEMMRVTGPNPRRVHIEARDAIAAVLRRWVFSEDRYTEVAETLTGLVCRYADEKHGVDGWRRIADQWLQPGGLAVVNFRACYNLLYSVSAHCDPGLLG